MSGRQAPQLTSRLHQALLDEVARQGITGYALAKLTGLPTSTMHRFLDAQGSPTLATVEAVAAALGLKLVVVALDAPSAGTEPAAPQRKR